MLHYAPVLAVIALITFSFQSSDAAQSLKTQNELLFKRLQEVHDLSDEQTALIRRIFVDARYMSQGNPAVTRHPATAEQCRDKLDRLSIDYTNNQYDKICGAKYMAPLYDPEVETAKDAKVCIDQFEFPDIPCEYPVVWVRTREAVEICSAMGKRICDAHEWEGGCAGQLLSADYRFDLAKGVTSTNAIKRMRITHNNANKNTKTWSYGPQYKKGVCGANSSKSPGCTGGSWEKCGSNTYPDGFFPECRSSLDVYDLNGNAAEHMNLPLAEDQMASNGSTELGYTEMKGSWFIFDKYRAHEDWCRWRAPYWHGSRVMSEHSHHNYHLGFRCCKTVNP